MQNRSVSLVSVALGLWIVIMAAVWHREAGNYVNAIVTGIIIVISALVALRTPNARFVTAAAGVWLIGSMFAWPNYSSPMVWNNAIVGAAVALVSLVGPSHADMLAS
jgi:hypothetical protein